MVRFEAYDGQIRPLIGCPSPRDIPDVLDGLIWINDDKASAKYYDEFTAYKLIRDFFLKYKKYNYLVIAPDDLVIERFNYLKLRDQVEKHNYPVFSATCNKNWAQKDISITCKELPEAITGDYKYYTFKELDELKNPIIQVPFDGFCCSFIRRDVVEKIDFRGYDKRGQERAFDFQFAEDCAANDIPILVDTSVRMLHLAKRGGAKPENWGIGFKTPMFMLEITRGPASRSNRGHKEMIDKFDKVVNSDVADYSYNEVAVL